jgi:hypothetical protein
MGLIPKAILDAWGVSFHDAMEAALDNLRSLPVKFARHVSKVVYWSAMDDNYDASRLLMTDACRSIPVIGQPIAMIPNRDNLLITGSDDVVGLAEMAAQVAKVLKEAHPISGIALCLDGEEWTPWLPPSDHPAYKDFQRLRLQTLGQDYAEQKELLDKLQEKNDEGVIAGSYLVFESPEGRGGSVAIWAADVDTLLPKADRVVFDRNGQLAMVEWQNVVDVVGDLMERLDIYPPRYLVTGFPSEKQLAAMGNMLNVLGDGEVLGAD